DRAGEPAPRGGPIRPSDALRPYRPRRDLTGRTQPELAACVDEGAPRLYLYAVDHRGHLPSEEPPTGPAHDDVDQDATDALTAQLQVGHRHAPVAARVPRSAFHVDPGAHRDPYRLIEPLVRDVGKELGERGPLEEVAERRLPLGKELPLL